MSATYFFQAHHIEIDPEKVGAGHGSAVPREQTLATLSLPAGSYVVTAKFDVAAGLTTVNDVHTSTYHLTFAGAKDQAVCQMGQSQRETVTMTVAGTVSLTGAVRTGAGGGGPLRSDARLYCDQVFPGPPNIYYISITAIPVDGVEKLSK